VTPGAAFSEIVGRYGDAWKLRVAASPERGKANDAVLDVMSRALEVPRARVELVAGQGSRDKVVVVRGLSARDTESRLDRAVSSERAGVR
jgi:uncharacterized protein YggU (UPF0235/DUF167 family)